MRLSHNKSHNKSTNVHQCPRMRRPRAWERLDGEQPIGSPVADCRFIGSRACAGKQWGRDDASEPHGRAVEPPDEADDHRRVAVTGPNQSGANRWPFRIADSSSTNAVSFSSARTTNRSPSRYASAIQMVRPLESTAETQPKLQPALLRLSAIDRAAGPQPRSAFGLGH